MQMVNWTAFTKIITVFYNQKGNFSYKCKHVSLKQYWIWLTHSALCYTNLNSPSRLPSEPRWGCSWAMSSAATFLFLDIVLLAGLSTLSSWWNNWTLFWSSNLTDFLGVALTVSVSSVSLSSPSVSSSEVSFCTSPLNLSLHLCLWPCKMDQVSQC